MLAERSCRTALESVKASRKYGRKVVSSIILIAENGDSEWCPGTTESLTVSLLAAMMYRRPLTPLITHAEVAPDERNEV